MAVQAGILDEEGVTSRSLEAHYLAGGNVPLVIKAIIAAHKARLNLAFKQAAAIDLAGRDVLEAVQTSVYPKVIDCPPRGSNQSLVGRGQERNRIAGPGPGDGARESQPDHRRGHRGDDYRPRRRRDRQRHRLGRNAQRSAGDAGPHLEESPLATARLADGVRDRVDRHLPTSTWATTSERGSRPTRPRPTCAWRGRMPKGDAPWP